MRIISGYLGGRRIHPPANMPHTRPTTDIAKEGLFNILQNRLHLDDLKSLDLFGGTGNISFELASRGVTDLTIVEKDNKMFDFVKKTAADLGLENFKPVKSDVFRFIDQCNETFDIIFAGPPYALQTINDLPGKIFDNALLNENGWFILEHTLKNNFENFNYFEMSRNYGTTIFSIFINKSKTD